MAWVNSHTVYEAALHGLDCVFMFMSRKGLICFSVWRKETRRTILIPGGFLKSAPTSSEFSSIEAHLCASLVLQGRTWVAPNASCFSVRRSAMRVVRYASLSNCIHQRA